MAAAWTVRPGRAEDAPSVLELFRVVFGKEISEEAYRWKFWGSPRPIDAPPTFVATVGEQVVGHFGGTPIGVRLEGRELPAVHGADTMVAEEFRRQGVITALIRAANEAWAAAGAVLQLAVPTQEFDGLREKLGYRPTVRLGWLWRPLWRFLDPPQPPGVEVTAVEAPGLEFDALWGSLDGGYDALAVRDRAWVAYRYAAAPGFGYRILLARVEGRPAGYAVCRVLPDGRSAWIADLFAAPDDRDTRAALVRAAFRELRGAGARDVRIFAPAGTPLSRELRRFGFLPRKGAFDVRVVPLAGELPWDSLRDPQRFYLAGGDFDVV